MFYSRLITSASTARKFKTQTSDCLPALQHCNPALDLNSSNVK